MILEKWKCTFNTKIVHLHFLTRVVVKYRAHCITKHSTSLCILLYFLLFTHIHTEMHLYTLYSLSEFIILYYSAHKLLYSTWEILLKFYCEINKFHIILRMRRPFIEFLSSIIIIINFYLHKKIKFLWEIDENWFTWVESFQQ